MRRKLPASFALEPEYVKRLDEEAKRLGGLSRSEMLRRIVISYFAGSKARRARDLGSVTNDD